MNIPRHQITEISHSKLILRDDNRTVTRSEQNTKLRAANIKEIGILQNIVVTKAEKEGFYYLEAGYGRHASVELLITDNITTADTFFYPAMIANEDNLSAIIKLAENSNRDALHPVDEFLTYQKAVSEGKTIKAIANTMGVTVKHVNQRLTLAKLSPVIIDALRHNSITVKAAEAFTLCNTERQEMIFSGLNNYELTRPDTIKARILETKISTYDPIAIYVGAAAYKKAGGHVTQSLFDETTIFENADLLRTLAKEKLATEAKQFGTDGWKWLEFFLGDPTDSPLLTATQPIQSTGSTFPPEKAQEITATQIKVNGLYDLGEPTEKDYLETTDLEARIYALEEEKELYKCYDETEMRFSGCIIGISPTGKIQMIKGRIHADDLRALHDELYSELTSDDDSGTYTPPAPQDETGYTQALTTDLSATRTALLQAAIAQSHAHAIDLGIFSIADSLLRQSQRGVCSKASSITLNIAELEGADASAISTLEKAKLKLNLGWTKEGKNQARFNKFSELSREEKDAIFAFCVARGIQPHLSTMRGISEPLQIVTNELNPNYRQNWTPERNSFFKRLSTTQLLEIGQTLFGDAWREGNKETAKKDLVDDLANAFSGKKENVTDDEKRRIAHWTPSGF